MVSGNASERDCVLFVFHVRREERAWADHVFRLFTAGLEASSRGAVEWEGGWLLDEVDDALVTGLGTLHAEYPASSYRQQAEAWNAGRERLGGAPHPIPRRPVVDDTPITHGNVRVDE